MKKTLIGLAAITFLAGGTPGFAMDNAELHKQLQLLIEQNKQLTERIMKLEQQVAQQETTHPKTATITEDGDSSTSFQIKKLEKQVAHHESILIKKTAAAGADKTTSFLKTLTDRVELSALVEVEVNATDDDIADPGEDTSDITLATVEIGLDAQLSKWSSGHILLLYGEGEEDDHIIVDEGTITLGNLDEFPVYLTAGKMYVPFGSFESNMISDPLTSTLGGYRVA